MSTKVRKPFNYQYPVLAGLIILSVILGTLILKPSFKDGQINPPTKTPVNKQTQLLVGSPRPFPSSLSADEIAVLNPPPPNANKTDKDKHFALVTKLAQDASELNLNKCNLPSPLVLKTKLGANINIKNDDNKDHVIVLDQGNKFTVPANKTLALKVNFPYGQGAYGYLCDDLPGVIGFFLVTP